MTDQYFLFDYFLPKFDVPVMKTEKYTTLSGKEVELSYVNTNISEKPNSPVQGKPAKVNIKARLKATYYRDDRVNRRMYVYHKGVDQLEIPYYEFKRIARADLDIMLQTDWPAFMRDEHGNLLSIYVSIQQKEDAIEWCQTNFVHRFAYYKGSIIVQDINDYVAIKMLYSN